MTLRELKVESVPVNFLIPVKGTPFEAMDNNLTPVKCLKILCLARFLNPGASIRAAGGRELNIRTLQPLLLYPANSIFVTGYLTTGGQSDEDASGMIADLGFEKEIDSV